MSLRRPSAALRWARPRSLVLHSPPLIPLTLRVASLLRLLVRPPPATVPSPVLRLRPPPQPRLPHRVKASTRWVAPWSPTLPAWASIHTVKRPVRTALLPERLPAPLLRVLRPPTAPRLLERPKQARLAVPVLLRRPSPRLVTALLPRLALRPVVTGARPVPRVASAHRSLALPSSLASGSRLVGQLRASALRPRLPVSELRSKGFRVTAPLAPSPPRVVRRSASAARSARRATP